MYSLTKSKEFLAMQIRDKKGKNNPQYGVVKSEQTLEKLRKRVYVYDAITLLYIGNFAKVECKKKFAIGYDTLQKYIDSGKPFKGHLFSSKIRN